MTKKNNIFKKIAQFATSMENNFAKSFGVFLSKNAAQENNFSQLDIFFATETISNEAVQQCVTVILRRRHLFKAALKVNFFKKMIARRTNIFRRKFVRFLASKRKLFSKFFIRKKYLMPKVRQITVRKMRSLKISFKKRYLRKKDFFLNILMELFLSQNYTKKIGPSRRFSAKNKSFNNPVKVFYLLSLFKVLIPRFLKVDIKAPFTFLT